MGKWFVFGLGHKPISHVSSRQAVPGRGLLIGLDGMDGGAAFYRKTITGTGRLIRP
jgi:hypothetical protein